MAEKEIKATDKAGFDFTKLNTLSVVSLATSVTGFGALAGVITGHIALSQIKKSNEGGRPLAIAGLVVGYAFIGFGIAATVARIVLAAKHGVPYGDDMMGGFGNMDDNRGGMVPNFGDQDGGRGGMMGDQGGMWGGPDGGNQLPPVDPNQQLPVPTPATSN
jgi:hypothetical protein